MLIRGKKFFVELTKFELTRTRTRNSNSTILKPPKTLQQFQTNFAQWHLQVVSRGAVPLPENVRSIASGNGAFCCFLVQI